jgi:uncharacterized membrane protein
MRMPWLWYGIRLLVLSGERIAFNRLGQGTSPLAAALVAYGGGALVLLPAALAIHHQLISLAALGPGIVYAASFMLYVWALVVGPLSVVAPWPAATALVLWAWHPQGGLLGIAGVVAVVAGGFVLTGFGGGRQWTGVGLMLLSDGFLAWGRLLDTALSPAQPLAYAFTLYAVVGLLFLLGAGLAGQWAEAVRLVRRAPDWAVLAGGTNGAAYVTVIMLLQSWPPYLVESLSGVAGVLTVIAGVLWLREGGLTRKLLGSLLMTAGAGLLVALHRLQ